MESFKNKIIITKERILEAFNRGDSKAVTKIYFKEAKLFQPNNNTVQGIDRIEAFWKLVMNKGIKQAELETINIKTSGATAFEIGNYWLFLENRKITDFGEYVAIWRHIDGEWKIYFQQWDSGNTKNFSKYLNIKINDAIINECELSEIGCSYLNSNSIKCAKCVY